MWEKARKKIEREAEKISESKFHSFLRNNRRHSTSQSSRASKSRCAKHASPREPKPKERTPFPLSTFCVSFDKERAHMVCSIDNTKVSAFLGIRLSTRYPLRGIVPVFYVECTGALSCYH
jgi:hypothetical protein